MVKCNRIEVISLLEPILLEYWEGENEKNGIYFDEEHGYVVSKVFAIKAEHQDNVNPLFFVTKEEDLLKKITDDYPFTEMKRRPQKRHLLFEQEELNRDELAGIFEVEGRRLKVDEYLIGQHLSGIDENIKNRRERQRTEAEMSLVNNNLKVTIRKDSKDETLIISEKMSKVNVATDDFDFPSTTLNTNSFYYTLKICESLKSVEITRDRHKVMFEGILNGINGTSKVKVVVALSKGRG